MGNYANLLKQADIFYGMTNTQLELVSSLCSERTFNANEIIFPEGATSDELYIILQGEVDILMNPTLVSANANKGHPSSTITTLRRGQSFGEMALVDHGLRSATARAAQKNTRLLVLPSENLMRLCEDYPQLGYRLMVNLAMDLAFKLRAAGLRMRNERLFTLGEKPDPDLS